MTRPMSARLLVEWPALPSASCERSSMKQSTISMMEPLGLVLAIHWIGGLSQLVLVANQDGFPRPFDPPLRDRGNPQRVLALQKPHPKLKPKIPITCTWPTLCNPGQRLAGQALSAYRRDEDWAPIRSSIPRRLAHLCKSTASAFPESYEINGLIDLPAPLVHSVILKYSL